MDALTPSLCSRRFCLFPAHWLSRDVGFIIVQQTRGPRRLAADFESGKQRQQGSLRTGASERRR